MPGDLAEWRPGRAAPAVPEGHDDAGICSPGRLGRRCRSSRHPTAWRPARSGRRGTSSWAARPSRTTGLRLSARWRPAPAPPPPVRTATPSTRSPWVCPGRRCHRRRCPNTPATTAGRRLPGQQRQHGPVMFLLAFLGTGQDDGGIGVEDRRDGRSDSAARRGALRDPRDVGIGSDAPGTAVLHAPGRPTRTTGHAVGHGQERVSGRARSQVISVPFAAADGTGLAWARQAARCRSRRGPTSRRFPGSWQFPSHDHPGQLPGPGMTPPFGKCRRVRIDHCSHSSFDPVHRRPPTAGGPGSTAKSRWLWPAFTFTRRLFSLMLAGQMLAASAPGTAVSRPVQIPGTSGTRSGASTPTGRRRPCAATRCGAPRSAPPATTPAR